MLTQLRPDRQLTQHLWFTAGLGSIGATLLSWPLLFTGHLVGVVGAALLLGMGPVLGIYRLAETRQKKAVISIAGATGYLLGAGLLSPVSWPILVGATLVPRRNSIGALLQWSLLGHIAGLVVSLGFLPPFVGQNPDWLQLGYLSWGLVWGQCVSYGLSRICLQDLEVSGLATNKQRETENEKVNLAIAAPVAESLQIGTAKREMTRRTENHACSTAPRLRAEVATLDQDESSDQEPIPNFDLSVKQVTTSLVGSGFLNVPETPSLEELKESLVTIATESWRVYKVMDRVLHKLDERERRRFQSRFNWFMKQVEASLEKADLRIINVENRPYDPGMAATPLNIEDFSTDDDLVVEQMIEPIIMGRTSLVQTGTVTLRKDDES